MSEIEELLGHEFTDPSLLSKALTHASAGGAESFTNERLEFLGDAVVDMVVSNHLFTTMPQAPEGEMTRIRAAVVSRRTLGRVGRKLGLEAFLRVDEGLSRKEEYPTSIVAGGYEAVVGALFLDGGARVAKRFVLRTLQEELERCTGTTAFVSNKSRLQENVQAAGHGIPHYEVLQVEGPDHERRFLVAVSVAGRELGRGWGRTKKDAEQRAAEQALEAWPGLEDDTPAPAGE